ncbi:MAG TPA: methylated-DNA--[protein]-cysteine S-methyltransferase, partial [Planctomycetota bacterium]|nr:methylated-DNA--[protein]-cysteine S-methyltransferase [Planctomycetota bacterium]
PRARITKSPGLLRYAKARLRAVFADDIRDAQLPLDVRATAFQARVWESLRAIPRGRTRTYAEIARSIGRPGSVRAVAGACASNPVALLIPCHRVIGSDGSLRGYRWGHERKKALLAREKPG